MPLPDKRKGPGTNSEAPPEAIHRQEDQNPTLTSLDDIAHHIDGSFVVVVEVTGSRFRRRCFLTAKAAQTAARRATDRGDNATVYLASLTPLWKLRGGEDQ